MKRLRPQMQPGDLKLIAQPLDFLGINNYNRVLFDSSGARVRPPESEYTDMGWEVHAPGLHRLLNTLHQRYPAHAALHHREWRGLHR